MPRSDSVPGLTRRKHRARYDRVLPKIGRVARSLRCDAGTEQAIERAAALNTLVARGDYGVIARWRDEGKPTIEDIARAVRTGEYGDLTRLSGPSLGHAVDEFMERTRNSRSPLTASQYDSLLRQVVDHFGADRSLASITSQEAERFLHNKENWQAASTQHDVKTLCGSVWQLAIQREQEKARAAGAKPAIAHNPWRGGRIQLRPETPTRHAYLLPEEWKALITHDQVQGTPTAALLALATLAGLRRGEIIYLRPTFDVDMDERLIHVQPREGEHAWEPKGVSRGYENSIRDVPMTDTLHRVLNEHIRRGYPGKRFFLRAPNSESPLSTSTVQRWTELALDAAGLTYGRDDEDGLTLHSLRHTFGTWLVSDGIPIPTVAKLMGNTPEIVLSTYAHHMPKDTDRALVALEERGRLE